ncbi:hypothetical protein [Pontibacillus litoralis]|uniref:Spore germination protein GerPD n=1 Tax=Pontibacillus litoralis JSM 072002 TaxID=1385512 RepID=A0A0A5G6V9_9BACI|nr:hypothetical protein [Pontibacillus litoralis]KGX87794.1 spore germination protein GerPD [Pontibacillus litoralis JSM 072002]
MMFEVHNCQLQIGNVKIDAISSSSTFLIGDNEQMALSSIFDTPPESIIITPFVPLGRNGESATHG